MPYSKILMVIVQTKYLKNSTNYLRLSLEIECNLKTVDYLEITLDLHWHLQAIYIYCKPNDETLYVHIKSDHPAIILRELCISMETRLFNPEIFHEASKHYQNM